MPAGPPATERLTTAAPEPEPETEAAQEVTMCKMPYKEKTCSGRLRNPGMKLVLTWGIESETRVS